MCGVLVDGEEEETKQQMSLATKLGTPLYGKVETKSGENQQVSVGAIQVCMVPDLDFCMCLIY